MENNEESILTEVQNGIQIVTLNRPKKKNAITKQMYEKLAQIFKKSANDENVNALVVTGNGDFYSSGNDFISTLTSQNGDPATTMVALNDWLEALICYPKLLIAIVNGPAIGIAATTLGLFDIVYASDTAYFWTPFCKLGISPEGCSSYTFPLIMGKSKAGEVLFFGEKLSAMEAKKVGFISKFYKDGNIDEIFDYIKKLSSLSKESLKATKKLLSRWNKNTLLEVNKQELEQLKEMYILPDFANSVVKILAAKSKM